MIQSLNLKQTIDAWETIASTVFVPRTEKEYEHLVEVVEIRQIIQAFSTNL